MENRLLNELLRVTVSVSSGFFLSLSPHRGWRGLFHKVLRLLIIFSLPVILCRVPASICHADEVPLVKLPAEERTWLDRNPEKLTLLFNTEFPPIEFSSASGAFTGMSAEIISMVEKRLGVTFLKSPSKDWNEQLSALKSGKTAVAPTIVATPEREGYAYFTTPYATVPVVIITNNGRSDHLTLSDLAGRRIAVVSGYATEKYLRGIAHGRFEVVPVRDITEGLRLVSSGRLHAFVGDLALAAHYIKKERISNLRVAGNTDFVDAWCIGVSRKYPLLYSSIQGTLDTIPKSEINALLNKWVSTKISGGLDPETRRLLKVIGVFAALLLALLVAVGLHFKRSLRKVVTNLKKAQEELLYQSEILRLATESTQAGIWDYYPPNRTVFLSRQWYSMIGYSKADQQVRLRELRSHMHPEDRINVDQAFNDYTATDGRGRFQFEFRLRRADGAWCWVLSKAKAVEWDKNGVPSRIIGLDVNIQSLKESQDKTSRSEAKFRAIFENAPYPIVINRLEDGRFLDANRAYLDARGIGRDDLIRLKPTGFSLMRDEDAAAVLNELVKNGFIKNRETTVVRKDGSHGRVIYSSVLVEIDGQKQILSISMDMTDINCTESALKECEASLRSLGRDQAV